MRFALYILAAASALMGIACLITAKAVTHEILGAGFLVIAAVLFSGGAIVSAVDALRDRHAVLPSPPPGSPSEATLTAESLDRAISYGKLTHRT